MNVTVVPVCLVIRIGGSPSGQSDSPPWKISDQSSSSGGHVGLMVGLGVGPEVGPLVGPDVGPDVGPLVGLDVGPLVG